MTTQNCFFSVKLGFSLNFEFLRSKNTNPLQFLWYKLFLACFVHGSAAYGLLPGRNERFQPFSESWKWWVAAFRGDSNAEWESSGGALFKMCFFLPLSDEDFEKGSGFDLIEKVLCTVPKAVLWRLWTVHYSTVHSEKKKELRGKNLLLYNNRQYSDINRRSKCYFFGHESFNIKIASGQLEGTVHVFRRRKKNCS